MVSARSNNLLTLNQKTRQVLRHPVQPLLQSIDESTKVNPWTLQLWDNESNYCFFAGNSEAEPFVRNTQIPRGSLMYNSNPRLRANWEKERRH